MSLAKLVSNKDLAYLYYSCSSNVPALSIRNEVLMMSGGLINIQASCLSLIFLSVNKSSHLGLGLELKVLIGMYLSIRLSSLV